LLWIHISSATNIRDPSTTPSAVTQDRNNFLRTRARCLNAADPLFANDSDLLPGAFQAAGLAGYVEIDAERLTSRELAAAAQLGSKLIRVVPAEGHDEAHAAGVDDGGDVAGIGHARAEAAAQYRMWNTEQLGNPGFENLFAHLPALFRSFPQWFIYVNTVLEIPFVT
jgi:hypothetical protein